MIKLKKVISVIGITSILLYTSTVHAEKSSTLLKMYDVNVGLIAKEIKDKIKEYEKGYEDLSQVVNENTMIDSAYNVQQIYNSEMMMEIDKEIYTLSDNMYMLSNEIEKNKEASVDEILKLDAEYNKLQLTYNEKQKERLELSQQVLSPLIDPRKLYADAKDLEELEKQIQEQKEKYKESSKFVELGDIQTFQSPLEIPVYVTSSFGVRSNAMTGEGEEEHDGLDMRAPVGTTVLSAFNGTVEFAGVQSGYGNVIIINHGDGIKTVYGHLSKINVKVGDVMKQYQPIGKSGNTGRSNGPHLHFGVYIKDVPVDPIVFITR